MSCCFQCPSCSGKKKQWQKSHLCFMCFLWYSLDGFQGGKILHKYIYYFLVARRFFKVSMEMVVGRRMSATRGKNNSSLKKKKESSVEVFVDRCQPNVFWKQSKKKKGLEMTARKKTTISCPYFFLFTRSTRGPLGRRTPALRHQCP